MGPVQVPSILRCGNEGAERQLKERVHGSAACIDGGYAGRRYNGQLLECIIPDVLQEGRFTCAGLAREKNILTGMANVFECALELGIGYKAHM